MTARAPRRVRRRAAGLVAALLLLLVAPALPATGDLAGLRGGRLTEAELARGTHVVIVWASWSPKCRDLVPRANAVARAAGGRARVITVAFRDPPADVEAFLRGRDLRVPVYLDPAGAFAKDHAITDLPGLLILRDGTAAFRGAMPSAADAAEVLGRHLR